MEAVVRAIRKLGLRQKLMLVATIAFVLAGIGVVASGASGPRERTARTAAEELAVSTPASARAAPGEQAPANARRPTDVAIASAYLGLPRQVIRQQLRAGRTLAQIASAQAGKSAAGLIDAIVAARTRTLQAALADGRIGSADEHERIARLHTRATVAVERLRALGGHARGRLTTAASYLGIKPADLLAQLRAGRTLAQIAEAEPGKSAAGLIAALVAAERARIDAAVAAGRLSRERADAIVAHLQRHVTARVHRQRGQARADRESRRHRHAAGAQPGA